MKWWCYQMYYSHYSPPRFLSERSTPNDRHVSSHFLSESLTTSWGSKSQILAKRGIGVAGKPFGSVDGFWCGSSLTPASRRGSFSNFHPLRKHLDTQWPGLMYVCKWKCVCMETHGCVPVDEEAVNGMLRQASLGSMVTDFYSFILIVF